MCSDCLVFVCRLEQTSVFSQVDQHVCDLIFLHIISGEPFTQEEMDEMLTAFTDEEKKHIYYKDVIPHLTLERKMQAAKQRLLNQPVGAAKYESIMYKCQMKCMQAVCMSPKLLYNIIFMSVVIKKLNVHTSTGFK